MIPVLQKAQYLSLRADAAELEVTGVDKQKIPVGEIMNQVIGQAGPALDLARQALGNGHGRTHEPKEASGN